MALSASAWASIPEYILLLYGITDTYVYDSNPKNLGVLDCLNYLKDKLVFTSVSKQEVQDALTRTVERVMDSPIKGYCRVFCELDKELEAKSGDLNTLRLSSYYIERSAEFHEKGESTSDQSNYISRKRQDVDFNKERTIKQYQTSLNSAIERLVNSECAIARYRILFLPEENFHRRLFTNEEWSIMEFNWKREV
ncbi:hypothetical protein C1646_752349 [Rhizophagus diaphanus]|nr:hypothetical protein C1646_752349 [Rhizophagus diaphanus] [Rhizophagus sp. MUCL 43196]